MNVPDIIGLDLDRARKVLENKGFNITDIRITAPPRLRNVGCSSRSRVIKSIGKGEGQVVLLVCNPSK